MHLEAHHPGRTPAPGVRALDGAAIAIEPGEAVGLLGPDAVGTCTASRGTDHARPARGGWLMLGIEGCGSRTLGGADE